MNNQWPTMNFKEWAPPSLRSDDWYGVVELEKVEPTRTFAQDLAAIRCEFIYEGKKLLWTYPVVGQDQNGVSRLQWIGDLLRSSYEIGKMREILAEDNVGMGTLIEVLQSAKKFHALLHWAEYDGEHHVQIIRFLAVQCWMPPSERKIKTTLVRVHDETTKRTDFVDLSGNVLMRDVMPELAPTIEKALGEKYGDIDWRTQFKTTSAAAGVVALPEL